MADLDDAFQPDDLSFVHFIASEQFGVIAKVAQKPVQLPQGFGAAIEPARKDVLGKPAGLKNGQRQSVVGLLRMPMKPDSLYANEENSIWYLVSGTAISGVQTGNLAFHAAPSFWPR